MPPIDPWAERFHAAIVRYAVPVMFGDRPHPQEHGHVNTASGVVVDAGEGAFFLTAAHVVSAAQKRARQPRFHFMAGPVGLDLSDRIVAASDSLDIATLRLSEREIVALERDGFQVVRPSEWPPMAPSQGSAIVLAGFPTKWRRDLSWEELSMSAMIMRSFVVSTSEGQFTTLLEPTYAMYRQIDVSRPALEVALPGLSGGPAFHEAATGLLVPRLCGIVKHGGDLEFAPSNYVVVYATLNRLGRDGSLA